MHENITLFSTEEEKNAIPFNVLMCGKSYCDGTYKITRPNSTICCMEYVCKGTGYVSVGDVTFKASAGDVYILPIGKDHFYYSDDKNPWEKFWFNINGNFVENTLEAYNINSIYHIKGLDLKSLFENFLNHAEIIKQNGTSTYNFDTCAEDFLKIVQRISSHIAYRDKTAPVDKAELLKSRIDSLTDFSLSFDEILKEFFYTKSHLIRIFKEKYGITPYDYLLERKTNLAKFLLLNTVLSIGEIAAKLGFANSHYFSNFFYKRVGKSPSKYRNH